MANNYTLFSTAIYGLTDEEAEWLEKVHAPYSGSDDDPFYEELADEVDIDELYHTFTIEETAQVGYKYAWFSSQDSANVSALADLMQAFLKRFRPEQILYFEWADTCSAPRPGEFGGGGVVVSAVAQQWVNSHDWVLRTVDNLQKAKIDRPGFMRLEEALPIVHELATQGALDPDDVIGDGALKEDAERQKLALHTVGDFITNNLEIDDEYVPVIFLAKEEVAHYGGDPDEIQSIAKHVANALLEMGYWTAVETACQEK